MRETEKERESEEGRKGREGGRKISSDECSSLRVHLHAVSNVDVRSFNI